jgi:flagellar biosynthetic protein FlhB
VAQDNRTEKPTPKRRAEARKRGQAARSAEVGTALVLAATVATLVALAPRLLGQLEGLVTQGIAHAATPDLVSRDGLPELLGWALGAALSIFAPFAAVAAVIGLVAGIAQVGLRASPRAVAPSFKKLDPVQGFKRLFGPQSAFEAAKTIVKLGIVAGAALLAVWPRLPELSVVVGMPPAEMLGRISSIVLAILLWVIGAFVVVALVDWLWQRRRHERSLKMTREEVRREARDADVSPEVRGRLKRRQVELARRRMLAEVPTADVVVTNPTHYAVALRYDGSKPAPEVVAKGRGHVAVAIRRLAEEHGVPVLRNAPLARALYREVDLGQLIPEAFFGAVAEVLAYVYRTARRRPASRTLVPAG